MINIPKNKKAVPLPIVIVGYKKANKTFLSIDNIRSLILEMPEICSYTTRYKKNNSVNIRAECEGSAIKEFNLNGVLGL